MGFDFFLQFGRTALHVSANSAYEGRKKMSLLVEKSAYVNSQDRVSFNWNEKDETGLSVYIKFSQRLVHIYACDMFLVWGFVPVFV